MTTTMNGSVPMSTVRARLKELRAAENPQTIEEVLARPIDTTARTEQARDNDKPKALPTRNVRAFIDALRDEEIEWGGVAAPVEQPTVTVHHDGLLALNIYAMRALGIPTEIVRGYPIRAGLMAHGTILIVEPVRDPDIWVPRLRLNAQFQPGLDLLDRAWVPGRYPAVYDVEKNRLICRREDWTPHKGRPTKSRTNEDGPAKPGPKGPRKSRSGVVMHRGDS